MRVKGVSWRDEALRMLGKFDCFTRFWIQDRFVKLAFSGEATNPQRVGRLERDGFFAIPVIKICQIPLYVVWEEHQEKSLVMVLAVMRNYDWLQGANRPAIERLMKAVKNPYHDHESPWVNGEI